MLDIIDEQDKSLANAFGDLDDDGNRLLTSSELVVKLNEILPEGLSDSEAEDLLASMDTDGDGNIDMVEFVDGIERHEDGISTIEDEEAETVKTFPTEWQSPLHVEEMARRILATYPHIVFDYHCWFIGQCIVPNR